MLSWKSLKLLFCKGLTKHTPQKTSVLPLRLDPKAYTLPLRHAWHTRNKEDISSFISSVNSLKNFPVPGELFKSNFLTLHHIPSFNDPWLEVFWKHFKKSRKCLLPMFSNLTMTYFTICVPFNMSAKTFNLDQSKILPLSKVVFVSGLGMSAI